jgi:hypothetical protein
MAYIVSIAGRRAVYLGRSGEAHVEMFPRARQARRSILTKTVTIIRKLSANKERKEHA